MRRLLSITIAALLAAGTIPAVRAQGTPDETSKATRISMMAFGRLWQMDQVLVVDVRDADSYRLGHIPGAVSMPLDQLAKRANELRGSGKSIVTYCA
jgi:3-mercaptopyruvate sulfurtransferase SseA